MRLAPYEHIDGNEYFILALMIVGYGLAFILPRRVKPEAAVLLFIWGFSVSKFYDFTIGGGVFDFYDVNDSSHYDVFDLISYFMYAPFAYFFIYVFESLKIRGWVIIPYILGWSLMSIGWEWLSVLCKVIKYKEGYSISMSIPIYILTQSVTLFFYKWVYPKASKNKYVNKKTQQS